MNSYLLFLNVGMGLIIWCQLYQRKLAILDRDYPPNMTISIFIRIQYQVQVQQENLQVFESLHGDSC